MNERHGLYIASDQSIAAANVGHHVSRETVNERFILVEDPGIGDFMIGGRHEVDKLFYDFFTTPNAFRAGGVSQLCKDEASATIPNTASFTRRGHLLALHGIIEHFAHQQKASDEQRIAWHLAAEGDDQAHTGFSHALELAVQQWGGPQDYHEQIWPEVAQLGGTTRVLDKHGVKYDKSIRVPGVKLPPWIARPERSDLDVDNLQYIMGEALLVFDHDQADSRLRERIRKVMNLDNIEVTPDGRFAFTDPEDALFFSKLMLLFATEHWTDPIGRIQLHLIIQGSQRAIVKRRIDWMEDVDKGQMRRPKNYLHVIDADIVRAMETGPGRADDFMYAIRNALHPIAMQERRRFIDYRLPAYTAFLLDDKARDYPSEYLSPKRVEFGPRSSSVSAKVKEYTSEDQSRQGNGKLPRLLDDEGAITYVAGPLKNRYIDPLVKWQGDYKRLSEINGDYKNLLNEQQKLQKLGVVVRLVFAPEYLQNFREGIADNQRGFEQVRNLPDLTLDQARRIIEIGAERARQAAEKSGRLILKYAA